MRHPASRIILASVPFLVLAASAFADHHRLYRDEKRAVPDYEEIVRNLQKGDTVEFGDKRVFRITSEPARSGMLDVIFKVEEGFALRVPKRLDVRVVSVDESHRAYRYLKSRGVQVVETIEGAYHPGQYLGVEWAEFQYYYHQLIDRKVPAEIRQKMLDDLIPFVKSTWEFRNIGDLREEQIVYDANRGWIIIDAIDEYSAVDFANEGTVYTTDYMESMRNQGAVRNGEMISSFGEKLRFPRDKGWSKKLLAAIEAERRQRGMDYTFCRQMLNRVSDWFKTAISPSR